MNKRQRREQYLATRRPAEYLEKRKAWKEYGKKVDTFFTKHPGFYDLPMKERYILAVQEGLIDPNEPIPKHFGIEL